MTITQTKKLPILRQGSKRDEVVTVKALLRSQGCWDGSSSKDFGPKLYAAVQYFQSTHIGSKGAYLKGDGEVGPETWWALYNPQADAKKEIVPVQGIVTEGESASFINRYGFLSANRKAFLAAAFAELALNVREIPDGSNQGGRVSEYIKGFGPAPWCALFVSFLFYKIMGRYPNGQRYAHVQTGYRAAIGAKRAYAKGTRTPVPGDIAIWKFAGDTGHVSIVVAVSKDGSQFNSIGGNESNRVKLGLRKIANEPQLIGFVDLFDVANDLKASWVRGLLSTVDTEKLKASNSR